MERLDYLAGNDSPVGPHQVMGEGSLALFARIDR
jgi:hypothetical protein